MLKTGDQLLYQTLTIKIAAEATGNRLQNVLPKLINTDQTGFRKIKPREDGLAENSLSASLKLPKELCFSVSVSYFSSVQLATNDFLN